MPTPNGDSTFQEALESILALPRGILSEWAVALLPIRKRGKGGAEVRIHGTHPFAILSTSSTLLISSSDHTPLNRGSPDLQRPIASRS